jgi:hypothetical protein
MKVKTAVYRIKKRGQYEAADCDPFSADLAAGIRRISSAARKIHQ